jgi:hypothetical protein
VHKTAGPVFFGGTNSKHYIMDMNRRREYIEQSTSFARVKGQSSMRKLLIYQDTSFVMCSGIFSEDARHDKCQYFCL